MVARALPREQLLDEALAVAGRLAGGAQDSIRFTKRILSNWIKQAGPIFDEPAALEMLGFMGADVAEGATALQEKRAPEGYSQRRLRGRAAGRCRFRLNEDRPWACPSGRRAEPPDDRAMHRRHRSARLARSRRRKSDHRCW
jgi:hypothetical protein